MGINQDKKIDVYLTDYIIRKGELGPIKIAEIDAQIDYLIGTTYRRPPIAPTLDYGFWKLQRDKIAERIQKTALETIRRKGYAIAKNKKR